MYKYNTVPILSTAESPFKTGTMDYLTEGVRTNDEHVAHSIVNTGISNPNYTFGGGGYASNVPYALWGSIVDSNTTTIIGSGAIIFNGEIFFMNALSTPLAAPASGCSVQITTTQYTVNADPVTLSDTSVHNLHDIRSLTAVLGTGGLFTLDQIQYLVNVPNIVQLTDAGVDSWQVPETILFNSSYSKLFSATFIGVNTMTFNFTNAIPGTKVRLNGNFVAGASLAFTKPAGCQVIVVGSNTNIPNATSFYVIYVTYVGFINGNNVVEVEILTQTNY